VSGSRGFRLGCRWRVWFSWFPFGLALAFLVPAFLPGRLRRLFRTDADADAGRLGAPGGPRNFGRKKRATKFRTFHHIDLTGITGHDHLIEIHGVPAAIEAVTPWIYSILVNL
jgi:hypothetical protein